MRTMRLLERCGVSPALIGDLLEQRRRGRSPMWFRRQVILALIVGSLAQMRAHKMTALLTTVLSSSALTLWIKISGALYRWAVNLPSHQWERWLNWPSWLDRGAGMFPIVWVAFLLQLPLVWCAGAGAIAWMTVRTVRDSPIVRATLLLTLMVQIPVLAAWQVPNWIHAAAQPPLYAMSIRLDVLFVVLAIPLCGLVGVLSLDKRSTRPVLSPTPRS